ncbi:hypothetical protein [Mucilaginibacter sp. CSA2-8R]|uniref:hypothetical protein n=1 Tax=Mucilaginibacter sp. CSA2-8R TaxID=3141542 RepID=UPI00315D13D6
MSCKGEFTSKNFKEADRALTAQAIVDIISGTEQHRRGLMMLIRNHNEELKEMIGKGVAEGMWTNFNTRYNHVAAFLKAENRTSKINILPLNFGFVKN